VLKCLRFLEVRVLKRQQLGHVCDKIWQMRRQSPEDSAQIAHASGMNIFRFALTVAECREATADFDCDMVGSFCDGAEARRLRSRKCVGKGAAPRLDFFL